MSTKTILSDYLLGQADWRERKAEEHRDDDRNHRAAATLRSLAAHVSQLPDDDDRLAALAEPEWLVHDGVLSPHHEVARSISRYGFNAPEGDMDALLGRLVQDALEGVMQEREEMGEGVR